MALAGVRSASSCTKLASVVLHQFRTRPNASPLPGIVQVWCRYESSLPAVETKQLTANIQLKTLQEPAPQPRPLILLFGWMLAKQRHLDKYGNLYHSKGFDVLSLKMRPAQVLIPQRAQATVEQLLKLLLTPELRSRPIMIHGFSVGGYMYGEYLVKLEQHAKVYADIRDRMVGQIFDSPVDFEGVPSGFATVLTKNSVARKVIQQSLEAYLRLFEKSITSHYINASKAFHRNSLKLPSLMLYSRSDPIGVDRNIENVMKIWKQMGIPVMSRCWQSSPHVSHFHRHPDEYVEAVLKFLDFVGLSKGGRARSDRPHVSRVSVEHTKKAEELQQAQ
ncbi:transmembrane protein 53-like protein [Plakobranchus ocellatus]|uniref:Transmembrane protein 53-like protein n=1 Tax=Plakobranchus ocellatus TaxID=259542 RepID=A0AAV3Y1P6_9GAST|nr:transmembrane protein 53-like protein [Plakobranchus ocellatus]